MVTTAYPAEQFRPLNSSTRWKWEERDRSGITYRGLTPVNQMDTFVVRLETPVEATKAVLRVFGYRASAGSFVVSRLWSLASGVQNVVNPGSFGPPDSWATHVIEGYSINTGATHVRCWLGPGDLLVGAWVTWQPGPGEFVSKVERIYDSRAASTAWGKPSASSTRTRSAGCRYRCRRPPSARTPSCST